MNIVIKYYFIYFKIKRREVSAETAEIFIKERNIDLFFETSAMKGEKINEVFFLKFSKTNVFIYFYRFLMKLLN